MAPVTVYILLTSALFSQCFCQSFLNIEELSAMKYGIEITNKPVLYDAVNSANIIYVSSKHGQAYSCNVPEIILNEEEQDNDQIDMKEITKILDDSFNGSCLTHNKGWWSYKVCHKKDIEQYHIGEHGAIEGLTLLGVYESEDDWSKKDVSELKAGALHHSQNYTKGSMCDLTSKPRRTVVQYYCSAHEKDTIIRVEEPSTCEYIITIHSVKLCSHPLFKVKEKTKLVELKCSPALKDHEYNKYLEKENRRKAKEEEEKKKEEEEAMHKSKNNEDGSDGKKVWKETANKIGKVFKSFVKTFDMKDAKFLDFNSLTDGISDSSEDLTAVESGESQLDSNTEDVNDAAKEMSELENANDDLLNEAIAIKKKFNTEYAQIKKHAENELLRSKKLLKSMEKLHEKAKTKKESDEVKAMMQILENNIELFQRQIRNINDKMNEVIRLEKITERKLSHINDELDERKLTETISNLLGTQGDRQKQVQISNTVSNILKKSSKLRKAKAKNSRVFSKKLVDGSVKDVGEENIAKEKTDPEDYPLPNEGKEPGTVDKETKPSRSLLDNEANVIDGTDDENLEIGNEADTSKDDSVTTDDTVSKGAKGFNSIFNLLKTEIKKLNKGMKKEKQDKDEEEDVTLENVDEVNKVKKDNMKVRVRTLNDEKMAEELEQGMENIDENTKEDIKAATKQMEEAVKQQLKDAGINLQSGIKIKIITNKDRFEKFGKNSKLLTDEDASDFKDMLLGFLGGGKEKISEEKRSKTLEENYNFVWDGNDEEDVHEKTDSKTEFL
ncbi:protein OS-9-like [Hydractinia symbiolongicarpus]|uniref:protein OS-9-like n=1 Tax=Hydractinia symbiolongicarpus TaxID=13093 RepID=UPI00254C95BD|nr:protein OS-9-like [Hydractinia symbiolongicarpus]